MCDFNLTRLSVRVRVEYAIQCLESLLNHLNLVENREWDLILSKLWSYCNIESIEEWHEILAEYIPFSIVGSNFEQGDFLTKEEYNKLVVLYSYDAHVNMAINLVFDVGTVDLYGKLYSDGQSLKSLYKVIDFLEREGIPKPQISKLSKFSFDDGDGWGRQFDKSEIF